MHMYQVFCKCVQTVSIQLTTDVVDFVFACLRSTGLGIDRGDRPSCECRMHHANDFVMECRMHKKL